MEPTIQLFPDQASTVAARVDNLYFFMIAVSAFFAVVVTVMVMVFRDQVPHDATTTKWASRFTGLWRSNCSGRASPS